MRKLPAILLIALIATHARTACGIISSITNIRSIQGTTDRRMVVGFQLDPQIFVHSQEHWADLRLHNAQGIEQPYAIVPHCDYQLKPHHTHIIPSLTQVEEVGEGRLALIYHVQGQRKLNLTKVKINTPLKNYEQTLTIFVPQNDDRWVPLGPPEALYDYSRYADMRRDAAPLPNLPHHTLKLLFDQADDALFSQITTHSEESDAQDTKQRAFKRYTTEQRPFRVDGIVLTDTHFVLTPTNTYTQSLPLPNFKVTRDTSRKQTVVELQSDYWPLTRLTLMPQAANFDRKVILQHPGVKGWHVLTEGRIQRTNLPGIPPTTKTTITFPEHRAARLRLIIEDEDNPPLSFPPDSITGHFTEYHLLFLAEPNQQYTLKYGDYATAPPRYEPLHLKYLQEQRDYPLWSLDAAPKTTKHFAFFTHLTTFAHGFELTSFVVMAALILLILRALKKTQLRRD